MNATARGWVAGVAAAAGAAALARLFWPGPSPARMVSPSPGDVAAEGGIEIRYPFNGAVFPPEIAAPAVRWRSQRPHIDAWWIAVDAPELKPPVRARVETTSWTPDAGEWTRIKRASTAAPATITVAGRRRAAAGAIVASARVSIRTSADGVGAPLFYREVQLPFLDAVRDPSQTCWRLGWVSDAGLPPVAFAGLPVCGSCHSFSADGKWMGMDVDYGNAEGSYAISPVQADLALDREKIIAWTHGREADGVPSFGLLSQMSPDGRYVASTVKDRSVLVARPGIAFSQWFFPVTGILAVYDRQTRALSPLPGADLPEFVQSNPAWSPDGRHIVFARSQARALRSAYGPDAVLLPPEECEPFTNGAVEVRFDLYRIPFNGGRGGIAEPLRGASANGRSNFFPKYSPDGRWIAFCRADRFMMLQPDSELFLVPADGGEARRLGCNTARMNSWHTWSPNGRWLAFSSKANSPYTQIFLAHVDNAGYASPAVALENFARPNAAANVPEFVNMPPGASLSIRERFVDERSFVRDGLRFASARDFVRAANAYRRALALNPCSAEAHRNLGACLFEQGNATEAEEHTRLAIRLDPKHADAHYNLGRILLGLGGAGRAAEAFARALELNPRHPQAHNNLGSLLFAQGRAGDAQRHYRAALEADPANETARNNLAAVGRIATGQVERARATDAGRSPPARPSASTP